MTEDIHSPYDAGWEKILSSLQDIYAEARLDGRSLADTAQKMRKFLADDLKNLSSVSPLIFNDDGDHDDQTHQVVNLLHSWHQQGLAPSLLALCMHALRLWGLEINPGLKHALTMAALLGEVDNTLPYHNNMHYRKVMLQLLRLIDEHQRIYAGTTQSLATEQIVLLLIAVCIHDLGHDGKGNTIKGVFVPGRLEKQSYDLALPYLRACGLTDEKMLADLRVMLLTTEVTPLEDPANPANQMKAAYRYHYLGENRKAETLNLDPALARLESDPVLALMALLLHEADIATSAGLTYAVTKFETSIYRRELTAQDARPEHIVEFLNTVCQRKFLSSAGQALFAGNMARIVALAEEEAKFGNLPFPQAEKADFLLLKDRRDRSFTTLN